MPSCRRAAARPPRRATSRIDWRTGAPVTTALGRGDPGKATADAAALLAASRLARPGVRSYETTTIGMRSRLAAKTAGMLAYPPTDTTTAGAVLRMNPIIDRV